MKLVPIAVVARGPLAFPERKPGVQFRTSLPYVPGGSLFGAVGELLAQRMPDSDTFNTLFRAIRCHNAYPALEGDLWSRPMPMTALRPKGGDTTADSVADSLYGRVCWEQHRPTALVFAPTDDAGRPWEGVGQSFYTLRDAKGNPWPTGSDPSKAIIDTREVLQRVLTRVSINRRRGTAEDGRLYSPLVISEVMEDRNKQPTPTRFAGSIIVPDDDTYVQAALADIAYIGGRQTTGIGAVAMTTDEGVTLEDTAAAIKRRVQAMTKRFRAQSEMYVSLGGSDWKFGLLFTVNLLSDALLFEQGWLPTNQCSEVMLQEYTKAFSDVMPEGYTGIQATLLRAFTGTTTVGGWNVSWQRPKSTAVATQMGSVFVFEAAELYDADYMALARLERSGIGERRSEGFGQIRICDEFHLLQSTLSPEEAS